MRAGLAALMEDEQPSKAARESRSDEELMSAFRDGEADAFDALVFRHRRGLFNFLFRSVHNRSRAEELLQDVFLRVIRAKDRYERTARFSTWVYTIARNICVDESRRAKFRQHASLEEKRSSRGGSGGVSILDMTSAEQVSTDEAAQGPQLRDRMAQAVDLLPEDQREVFLMRQLAGLSFKEIGQVVGAPENTVKSRMRYALEKLRGELADLDPRQATRAKKAGIHG
jgi:RNA polymerase sigma-70 factor (ECF subfamily)